MGLLSNKAATRALKDGQPVPAARRYVFAAGGDTLTKLFKDENLTTTQANPSVADENGYFDLCYLTEGVFRIVIKDDRGNHVSTINDVRVSVPVTDLVATLQSHEAVATDAILSYDPTPGRRQVAAGETITIADGNFAYRIVEQGASQYHVLSAGGVKFDALRGERGFNVCAFGARADGVTDDTAAIQAAIDTGVDVFFPDGVYRASGLTLNNNNQRFTGTGSATLQKNADGPLISGSGDRVTIQGLIIQGGTGPTPEYTGDNIVMSGNGFQFVRSASYWCMGRAIKVTGEHVLIADPIHTIATADTSGNGYDIELGQAGVATLYHRINNWYAGSFDGGILLIDTGSHMMTNSLFGKLTIQAGTAPAGTNGGMTSGCRIGRAISVGLSNAVLSGNQPSSSDCDVVFEAATSGCRWDLSNTQPLSITNNGNANNLIMQETSAGAVATLSFGGDAWAAPVSIAPNGDWSFPSDIELQNNFALRIADSSGNQQLAASLSSGDDWFFGSDTGPNFTYFSSGSSGIYLGPSGVATVQVHAGGMRPTADGAFSLGSASQRWSTIYATTGTINTSDEREKQDIRKLTRAERAVAKDIKRLVRAFRWRDAVAEKGDSARTHIGVIAQEVDAAFAARGLDAASYGILCHDSWDAQEERRDDEGNVIVPEIAASERFGVRYEELIAFVLSSL